MNLTEHLRSGPRPVQVHIPSSVSNDSMTASSAATSVAPSTMRMGRASPKPSGANTAGGTSAVRNLSLNRNSNSTAGSGPSLAKPTLEMSQIRWCPTHQWVPEAQVMNCMAPGCDSSFSLFNRKHRCKICGRIFCSSCCSNTVSILAPAGTAAVVTDANGRLVPVDASTVANNRALLGAKSSDNASYLSSADPSGPGEPASEIATVARTYSSIQDSQLNGNGYTNPLGTTDNQTPGDGTSSCRVCNGCYYELQLVVSTRQESGELRRKSRGELKFFQRALVVNILSFLPLKDLGRIALVSSDFYFMSRDNLIWYQYNMLRWVKDSELPPIASLTKAKDRKYKQVLQSSILQDASALTDSEAAKRVISLHARYNFTQFLDFARRQEMARCEGISSFSIGARILLSSPIKIAIIGPSRVGKTACVHAFLGDNLQKAVVQPTVGFTRHVTSMQLTGGITTEVTCHIYDLSGAPRYEALRRFICRHCHVIGLCYNPHRKVTLIEAADIMMGVETSLRAQPVVVCGLKQTTSSRAQIMAEPETPNGAPLPHVLSASTLAVKEEDTEAQQANKDLQARTVPRSAPSTPLATKEPPPPHQMAPMYSSVCRAEPSERLEVSESDAVGITVRGRGSLQCPLAEPQPFFAQLIQCLLDSLALGTMVTATMADLSREVTESESAYPSMTSRMRSTIVARQPKANQTVAEELLNITMQPSALDIMLEKK